MSRPRTKATVALALAVGVVCSGAWVWNLAYVPTLVNDDAFIYLRYARNLVEHGTLAWNRAGPGGDGFTSLLYQLLAALSYLVAPGDPVSAVWYLSVACGLATVLVGLALPLARGFRAGERATATILATGAGTCVTSALNPQFAYYLHSLMETGLVALVVCLASWATARVLTEAPGRAAALLCGGTIGLLAPLRPEGLLVSVVLVLLLAVRLALAGPRKERIAALVAPVERAAARNLLAGLLVAVAIGAGCFAWHLARYGHAFPNPVYVKTTGVSVASVKQGMDYLFRGPAGGSLPGGAIRFTPSAPAEPVGTRDVHAAITPDRSPLPSWALLALVPALWLFSFQTPLFRSPSDAMFVRHLLLVPTGWLGLVVLAGGDIWHSGWRFVTPLLPAVAMTAAVAVRRFRLREASWLFAGLLGLLSLRTFVVAADRPELCAKAASACGMEAVHRWPPALDRYEWDVTNAWYDRRVAEALRASFPPDTVIGQSDFLRIGAHLPDHTIADLSGLTDPELAHSERGDPVRVFTADLLAKLRPPVYLFGYRFISPRALADYRLDDPVVGKLLYPWPPIGSTEGLAEIQRLYVGASIAFPNGTYFNFLVLRDAVPTLRRRDIIRVGP